MTHEKNPSIENIAALYNDSLERDRERNNTVLENQKYLIRSILGIGSFLIVGLGGSAAYLIGSSV